jgi:hypothetical protein
MFDVLSDSQGVFHFLFIHKGLPLCLTPNLLKRVQELASYLRTVLFWAVTQRVVVITYRRCVTTCKSHLKGSGIAGFLALEYGTGKLSQNVGNYYYTLRNSPKEDVVHLHCGGKLRVIPSHGAI